MKTQHNAADGFHQLVKATKEAELKRTEGLKIPKYVKDLLDRSSYVYDDKWISKHEHCAVGYTMKIRKSSDYASINTLKEEVKRLCKWANKAAGLECAYVIHVPNEWHYAKQEAVVTIFDPVMKRIKQYIK